ncbi:hypothetical protein HanRHA438_Chr12g0540061 [Helianthus annuus]|nr:hypothetical protein HanRHA438_Chr12g0540061 [Helianthus annuus]
MLHFAFVTEVDLGLVLVLCSISVPYNCPIMRSILVPGGSEYHPTYQRLLLHTPYRFNLKIFFPQFSSLGSASLIR